MSTTNVLMAEEREFAAVMVRLVVCNHFLPERIELERLALGAQYRGDLAPWNLGFDRGVPDANVQGLVAKTAAVVAAVAGRLGRGGRLAAADRAGYRALVEYHLYQTYRVGIEACGRGGDGGRELYRGFLEEWGRWMRPLGGVEGDVAGEREALLFFAGCWQNQRAFANIFANIVGTSAAIARLRAAVWESVFTRDMGRYRRGLYERMRELTTLITGPSGTGKELVARAVAHSGFLPFDPRRGCFAASAEALFFGLNLSALSPGLVESELFGHRRGAFTGALQEHAGWLEVCPREGAVFLDEIGELDPVLQVKLLRVLQTRSFNRLGESRARTFQGKILAATNRDLGLEMQAGRFREDLYYRLCSDTIRTPSLAEQLREAPGDLERLAGFIAARLVGEEESVRVAREVVAWVARFLGVDYAWPGNFRELEQCVRSVVVRGRYEPVRRAMASAAARFVADLETGQLRADEVLRRYCEMVYRRTGSVRETARRLDLDWRTVRAKLAAAMDTDGEGR